MSENNSKENKPKIPRVFKVAGVSFYQEVINTLKENQELAGSFYLGAILIVLVVVANPIIKYYMKKRMEVRKIR